MSANASAAVNVSTDPLNPIILLDAFKLIDDDLLDRSEKDRGVNSAAATADWFEEALASATSPFQRRKILAQMKAQASAPPAPPVKRVDLSDDLEVLKPEGYGRLSLFSYFERFKRLCSGQLLANQMAIQQATSKKNPNRLRSPHHRAPNTSNTFMLENLLSPAECEHLIETSKDHMQSIAHLYKDTTRGATRLMVKSPSMADALRKRILPHVGRWDYAERSPMCFGHEGVWVPWGLNECLKVFRYDAFGSFVEHRDGPWIPQHDRCSMYTVLIYLNDNFGGGNTVFSDSDDRPQIMMTERGNSCAPSIAVKPKTGMAVIFNHDRWHSGNPVLLAERSKWILRTELIFMRVHSFYVDRNKFATDEGFLAMKALYDEAQEDAVKGNRDGFFTKYQEVVRLQRNAMLSEESSMKPRLLPRLGLEELSVVLSYLPDAAVSSLLPLNKRTFRAIAQAPYWQDRFEGTADRALPLRSLPLLNASGAPASPDALRAEIASSASPFIFSTTIETRHHNDYFTLVRQRLAMAKCMKAAGMLLLSSGITLVGTPANMRTLAKETSSVSIVDRDLRPVSFARLAATNPSVRCVRIGNIFSPGPPSYHVRCFDPTLKHQDDCTATGYAGSNCLSPTRHLLPQFAQCGPSLLRAFYANDTPLLVVPPCEWFDETLLEQLERKASDNILRTPPPARESGTKNTAVAPVCDESLNESRRWYSSMQSVLFRRLTMGIFEDLRVPAVAFCHPAICAAMGLRRLAPEVVGDTAGGGGRGPSNLERFAFPFSGRQTGAHSLTVSVVFIVAFDEWSAAGRVLPRVVASHVGFDGDAKNLDALYGGAYLTHLELYSAAAKTAADSEEDDHLEEGESPFRFEVRELMAAGVEELISDRSFGDFWIYRR